ncbi:RNA polymerase subunit sigma [Nonomuraea aridisoli]|uniref:RNA polymerase sigma factor n=2 Tax=Nonomuraea aridisoli TaxID=2070368 RepID=A0A2W2E6Q5_9ACTN|nr:sigma-70 family RNA polymerase sigma factor [Nonomuraea aridisoli]PZG09200.1 RNA polymerase subunit sigma [Nonomuraea aridisoli]
MVQALYRQYGAPLMAFAVRLTGGDRRWAEDVVQETLVRAWRNLHDLRTDSGSLMPWLATVARRVVIDDRRRSGSRPLDTVEDVADRAEPVAAEDERLLREIIVTDAMMSLSPAHRQVLTETFLLDRTLQEAAEIIGVPVGTVKSRVYYAMRALRVALEERGVTLP